ncbi:hypothetical protein Tco_0212274 [Tanacetum coccineum]
MADDQPMWGNNRVVAPTPASAIVLVELGDNFHLKGLYLSMIKEREFDGHAGADLHKHIYKFIKIYVVMDMVWDEEPSSKSSTMDPKKKLTMSIEDIKETTTVGILEIGATVNQETTTVTHNPMMRTIELHQQPKRNLRKLILKKLCENSWSLKKHRMSLSEPILQSQNQSGKGQKDHQAAIQDLETKFCQIYDQCFTRPTGSLPSNTQTNLKPFGLNDQPYHSPPARNKHVNVVFTDPPVNLNDKATIIHDDSDEKADEAEKEEEPSSSKPNKSDQPSLKAYKLKIPYPQCLRKEKMKEHYAKFIDMIKEDGISISLVDVLAGMPNYGKFLKDLVSNKSKMEKISADFLNEECSAIVQNKLPPKLDFVILEMEEDNKVPLILGRPFMHTVDAIIRVKSKELNLGVRDDRITFLIDKAMQHSHSGDDTCFCITSEKINETFLDKEFKEFIAVDVKEILEQEEEVNGNFEELSLDEQLRIMTSIREPSTDLKMKPMPKHLEYAFMEKDSLLPIIISALLEADEEKRLVSILKMHKEAFA